MPMKLWQIVMIFGLVATAFAQTNSRIETKSLEAYYNGNYSGRKQFVLPALIDRFLPKVLLVRRNERPFSTFGEEKLVSLIKKTRFLEASEYSVTQIHDRLEFPSIEFGNSRYIFAGENFKTKADTEIFNLFLKEANLRIDSEKEAAELANLYFSVTRGYFENKGKLILSGVEDVPVSYRETKEVEAKRLQQIVAAPKTKRAGESFEVELFTWEMALGEVKNWTFKIQRDAQIELQSKVIGKL
jgi:hypothetical protein